MTDTPSDGPDGPQRGNYLAYLTDVANSDDLAFRVKRGDDWPLVSDDIIAELNGQGPTNITDLVIYEKHRVAANREGTDLLNGRSDCELGETQLFAERGVTIFRVDIDAFDFIHEVMPDGDFGPEPGQFSQRSSAGQMDKVALLHGFLVQGHSFFFNDDVEFDTGTNSPKLLPEPTPEDNPQDGTATRRIGIIDTGADTKHPWLDGIDADEEKPGSSHGTIVTGIARQGDPYASIVVRRPKNTTNYILRELSIAAALYELIDTYECDFVNCSFGASTFGKVPLFRWVIGWLRENVKEFKVVAAAGNRHGKHARNPIYPAAWKEVTAVAAGDGTVPADETSYYEWSNGGAWVDEIVKIDKRNTAKHWLRSSAPTDAASKDRFAFVVGTSAVAPLITAQLASESVKNAHEDDRV